MRPPASFTLLPPTAPTPPPHHAVPAQAPPTTINLAAVGDSGHLLELTVPPAVVARDVACYIDRCAWIPPWSVALPPAATAAPRLWRIHRTATVASVEIARWLCDHGRPTCGDRAQCGVEEVVVTDTRVLWALLPIAPALTAVRVAPGPRQCAWALAAADEMDLGALSALPIDGDASVSFSALRSLNVSHRPFVCDTTLSTVASVGATLTELDVSGGCFTDAFPAEVLSQLPHLISLAARGCMLPRHFVALLAAHTPTLVRLDLTGCSVAAATVPSDPAPLPQLRHLAVANAVGIDDAAVALIVDRWPRLRGLDISACRAVTDAGLRHVASLIQLQVLHMAGMNTSRVHTATVRDVLTDLADCNLTEVDVTDTVSHTTEIAGLVVALRCTLPPGRRGAFVLNGESLPRPRVSPPPQPSRIPSPVPQWAGVPSMTPTPFIAATIAADGLAEFPGLMDTTDHIPRCTLATPPPAPVPAPAPAAWIPAPRRRTSRSVSLTASATVSLGVSLRGGAGRSITAVEALGLSVSRSPAFGALTLPRHAHCYRSSGVTSTCPTPQRSMSLSCGTSNSVSVSLQSGSPAGNGALCGFFRAFAR